ncbi:hypothetical protein FJTKL_04790 [Diaporthe vaccinii]|uniref:Carrier domain-containing protein n=1 Tax=Diaporthe vaccinii TaxID=105482 RepID=A0ABR4DSR9_9PEZI
MSHKACTTNFRHRQSLLPSLTSSTRVLQFSSFAFDVSVFDIFGTLSAGACIVIPHETLRVNPRRLSRFMTEKRVTWASLSPTFAELLDPDEIPGLETLILGGEPLSREVIDRWKTLGPSRAIRLGNELGPSETCVACVGNYEVGLETHPQDLGRSVGGNKLFLVDRDNSSRLAPVGCVGELVAYGNSLMTEYIGDPVRTDEAFVQLPEVCNAWLQETSQKRAFKTGDLFWLNDQGRLMFAGRKDRQLKWRGFRLEAGEVEACIKLEDGVKGAVVELTNARPTAQDDEALSSDQALIAFFAFEEMLSLSDGQNGSVVSSTETTIIDPSSSAGILSLIQRIKARVKDRLPHYMAPTLYVPITNIPTITSGKLDRAQLKRLLESAPVQLLRELQRASHANCTSTEMSNGSQPAADSLNPTERSLKALWTTVLGLVDDEDIGHDSNFFHLGGNSIRVIQLSSLASKMGLVNLSVVSIHESPTLRGMAASCLKRAEKNHVNGTTRTDLDEVIALVKERICTALRIRPVDVEDIYPCTPLQQGLLAVSIRQPGTYVVSRIWRLGRQVNEEAFQEAWGLTIGSNEILRTSIAEQDGNFWQVVVAHKQDSGLRQVMEEMRIRGLDLAAENGECPQAES